MSEESLQKTGKKRSKKAREKGKDIPNQMHNSIEYQGESKKKKKKKVFLSEQCKEIEENNRMGKTRDLFKKTGEIKGTFHAKMGSIKDRNGKNLTEAEEIKKRYKNKQKTYTKKIKQVLIPR